MTEREIKRTLKSAAEAVTPDLWDRLAAECETQPKGNVIVMTETKKKNKFTALMGIAAAVALFLLLTVLAAGMFNRNTDTVPTTVALDVNPSLEIRLDGDDRVLEVVPLNKDARTVLGDMDFRDSGLEITVNALIGSMVRNGYLNELANSVLISVDSTDPDKAVLLQKKLTEDIRTLLNRESFQGSVISQTVSKTDELKTLAEQYGISVGKVKLINEMIRQNPLYTFEDLAPLSVNELNLLRKAENLTLENTQTSGAASDKAFIGADAAIAAAKAHAQVAEVTDLECELDSEKGIIVYEVEFRTAEAKYEYDINATDGSVIKSKKKDLNGPSGPQTSTDDPFIPATLLTATQAKEKAFAHAGVNPSDVWDTECKLDHDDGSVKYEIEFNANGYEFEYDVDAYSGEILKAEKEKDN